MGRWSSSAGVAGVAVLIVVLLVGGIWAGSQLRGTAIERLGPAGALLEVQLDDGTVYLGSVASDDDGLITLASPAVVAQTEAEGDQVTFTVQAMSAEPYSILGPIVIARDRVTFIGAVSAGSPIEAAYLEAMGAAEASPDPP